MKNFITLLKILEKGSELKQVFRKIKSTWSIFMKTIVLPWQIGEMKNEEDQKLIRGRLSVKIEGSGKKGR